jgi:hypothetical protein
MSLRLSLPVVLMSAVGLLALGFVASCGGKTSSSTMSSATSSATMSSATANAPVSQTTTSQPANPNAEVRLGCGTFCQNAGGYGGAQATEARVYITKVVEGAVSVDADGYVPVTVTCLVAARCQGAITLNIHGYSSTDRCGGGVYSWAGCSDLVVNANSTQTIGVPLTAGALAYVRTHSPVTVGVTANASQTRVGQTPGNSDLWPFSEADLQVSAR